MLKRWADWPLGIRWLVGIVAVVLALAIVWALFVPVTDWLANHDVGSAKGPLLQTARDAARGRLLTLGAGLFAAGALIFTAQNFTLARRSVELSRRTFELTEQGQVTDRYTKAIEQLGSDKLDVRIGGIYALERIARDSERDHPTVMEVLTAFIRERSHEQWPPSADDEPGADVPGRGAREDVQAAVTVIGRRNAAHDWERRLVLYHANLVRADLAYANFAGAYLVHADLTRADLRGVDLQMAILSFADLVRADLTDADLTGANLYDAKFNDAILTGARWPEDARVPKGWKRDPGSGRLVASGTESGPAEAS